MKYLTLCFIFILSANLFAKNNEIKFVDGLEPALKSAFTLLAQKADKGDGPSQMRLGLQYYSGKKIAKDDDKAIEYLQKAYEQKTPQAKEALKIIQYNLGIIAQKNNQLDKAAQYLSAAAKLGDNQAKESLAKVEDKLIPFPPAGVGLKDAKGGFPTDIEKNQISAVYEYVYACLEDVNKALEQSDFSRNKVSLAYGDITISKSSNIFTVHDLDPVTAEAVYRGLRPNKKVRVMLQGEGVNKTLVFGF